MRRLLWIVPVLVLFAVIGLWAAMRLGHGPLAGLRIGGQPIDSAQPLDAQLAARAKVYGEELVVIRSGPSKTQRMRRELGAALDAGDAQRRAEALGRSGHLLGDFKKWWQARRGRVDLEWPPVIDEKVLGAFVSRERERLEVPPKVGVSDGEGWSLPGENGVTLDYHRAMATLKRALAAGKSEVDLELSTVPAPEPIVIGTPDGALFDAEAATQDALAIDESAATDEVPSRVYAGIEWLPGRGKECFERPPMPPFCEGPRMAPRPTGQAAVLASELGLGGIPAVRHVLLRPPETRWVVAAGGPVGRQSLIWPVAAGRFGRGFGYVRKRIEVRDQLHKGIDMPARIGSAIRAASDAIGVYADNGIRGYGNLLILAHADGSVTFSAHCRRIFVAPGQRVKAGQIVAEVGLTGMTLGPHLHFEYHVGGQPTDPDALFVQRPAKR